VFPICCKPQRQLSLLVAIWALNTGTDRLTVLSADPRTVRDIRSDGPRPRAGTTLPLRTSERSAMAQRVLFAAGLDLVSRKGPHRGGEILGCALASPGHPRHLLVNVEPKRGEGLRLLN
jgi:hypothetical protein